MQKTILRLMGLILGLQGILTIGLTMQCANEVTAVKMIQSKECISVMMGIMLFLLAECRMGGFYEN